MSVEDNIKESLAASGIDASEAIEKATEFKKGSSAPSKDYTEFEREQMEKGWNPEGVKSAEEYARTEPLYEEIKQRGKELKRMQKAIDSLTDHMNKQEKLAYDKALETLRKEKEDAIYRGDVQAVMDIEQQQHSMTNSPKAQLIPEVEAFTEKYIDVLNSPGFEEMEIVKFITQRDVELASLKLSPKEHMATLEQHMLKKFPDFFSGEKEVINRNGQDVETGQGSNVSRRVSKNKYTFNDLNPEQKQVARDFEKFGIMKVDDYIKQLVELKELK